MISIVCISFYSFAGLGNKSFKNSEVTFRIYTVNLTTNNKQLKLIEENLERELQGTSIKFSEIKRNKQQQLIQLSIGTKFNGETNFRKNITLQKESSFPIKLSVQNADLMIQHKDESVSLISKNGVRFNGKKKHHKKIDKTPLYIFNEKILDSKSNEVLFEAKDDCIKITTYPPEEAIKRFGKKAKNGAIHIEKISVQKFKSYTTTLEGNQIYAIQNPNINKDSNQSTRNIAKPLFIINGKKATEKQVNNLNENNIEKVVVLKDKSATKKYGKEAENGVIEITLQKQ